MGKLHLDFHSVGELHLHFCLCWCAPFAFFVCVESSIWVLISVGELHLRFGQCGQAPFGFSQCERALVGFCSVWASSIWVFTL